MLPSHLFGLSSSAQLLNNSIWSWFSLEPSTYLYGYIFLGDSTELPNIKCYLYAVCLLRLYLQSLLFQKIQIYKFSYLTDIAIWIPVQKLKGNKAIAEILIFLIKSVLPGSSIFVNGITFYHSNQTSCRYT